MPAQGVAKKLLIKPGSRVLVLTAPPGYPAALDPLPEGAGVATEPAAPGAFDVVMLFARDQAAVLAQLPGAQEALRAGGVFWIAYPKGGAGGTDLNRDRLWQLIEPSGWIGVTLVALDPVWSALRFRPADQVRR
jgi:hypothetical protein